MGMHYGAYTFAVTPEVRVSRQRLADTWAAVQGYLEVWQLDGALLLSEGNLVTQWDALVTAFSADGSDLTLKDAADSATLLERTNASALRGVRVTQPPTAPRLTGAQFATLLNYSIELQAEVPVTPIQTNAIGYVTVSTRLDQSGQSIYTKAGRMAGSGAQTAADGYKAGAGVVVLSEMQTEDSRQQQIDFNYQYLLTASSRDNVDYQETVALDDELTLFVHRSPLGGGTPTKQTTVARPARATQSGTHTKRSAYPSFPSKLYSASYLSDVHEERHGPQLDADGNEFNYRISWRYVYEHTSLSMVSPNSPPTT